MLFLFGQLEFEAPGRLIVLALLPALAWVALGGRRAQAWPKVLWSTSLRSLVVVLLCIAWAAPSFRTSSDRRFVIFAIDESVSANADRYTSGQAFLEEAAAAQVGHQVRWLTFGERPGRVETGTPPAAEAPGFEPSPATDIAAAIHLAQAACPANHVPHVVLLTDGRETRGRALAAAAAAEIPISVVPLTAFSQPEIAIDAIEAPSRMAPHETAEVVVTVAANHASSAILKLLQDGEIIARQPVEVSASLAKFGFPVSLGSRPSTTLRAELEGGEDTFVQNNALEAIILAGEPARLLLVEGRSSPSVHLQQSLQAGGFVVQRTTPQRLELSPGALEPYRLIVLSGVSASGLGPERLAALEGYVRAGGGLIAVGGSRTFGAAAYELTALERLLPVAATEQSVEQQKSLALVLLIDKSLSMREERRLELAKVAAKKVAEVLEEHHQVGVLAFGDDSQWVSRLGPLADKERLFDRIDRLQAIGLTHMYPAMQRAYLSLSQADADIRHAILLSDGGRGGVSSPGDFDEIARRMADAGITVSTIALGEDADPTILEEIARIARGNYHHVADAADLPKIFEGETRSAASKIADQQFPAHLHRQLPGLDVADAPPLSGYVATSDKAEAQLLLTAGEGDPLLAWWRYGRGTAMVLTTDLDDESNSWHKWRGFPAFWKRIAEHALRPPPPADRQLYVRQHDGRVTATFDAFSRSEDGVMFLVDEKATLRVRQLNAAVDAREPEIVLEMPQVAPGRYEASFTASPGERLIVEVVGKDAAESEDVRGIVIGYPEEFRLRPAETELLKTIASATGGTLSPQPAEVFAPDGRTVAALHPLWPYVLMAAVLVYLADVAARRMRIQPATSTAQPRRKAA